MGRFELAADKNEQVAGVICSFHNKWNDHLKSGDIKYVFRKKTLTLKWDRELWMYPYLTSPVAAITCRLPIEHAELLSIREALKFADAGCISVEELEKYAGNSAELFVLRLGNVQVAKTPVNSKLLNEQHGFWPTPNFIRLSDHGADVIDQLAQFNAGSTTASVDRETIVNGNNKDEE